MIAIVYIARWPSTADADYEAVRVQGDGLVVRRPVQLMVVRSNYVDLWVLGGNFRC